MRQDWGGFDRTGLGVLVFYVNFDESNRTLDINEDLHHIIDAT